MRTSTECRPRHRRDAAPVHGVGMTGPVSTMNPDDLELIRKALTVFADDHEYRQHHSCADATRARALANTVASDVTASLVSAWDDGVREGEAWITNQEIGDARMPPPVNPYNGQAYE
jgi:hypothetical protein